MPFLLILAGVVLAVTAYRGTTDDFFVLLRKDFTGPGNFVYWILAIGIVGLIGYYQPFRPVSRAFLFLLMAVFILSNKGFFNKFVSSVQNASASPSTSGNPARFISLGGGGSSSGSGGSGGFGNAVGTAIRKIFFP